MWRELPSTNPHVCGGDNKHCVRDGGWGTVYTRAFLERFGSRKFLLEFFTRKCLSTFTQFFFRNAISSKYSKCLLENFYSNISDAKNSSKYSEFVIDIYMVWTLWGAVRAVRRPRFCNIFYAPLMSFSFILERFEAQNYQWQSPESNNFPEIQFRVNTRFFILDFFTRFFLTDFFRVNTRSFYSICIFGDRARKFSSKYSLKKPWCTPLSEHVWKIFCAISDR